MKKILIHVSEPDFKKIKSIAKKQDIAYAELIRRIMNEYLERDKDKK